MTRRWGRVALAVGALVGLGSVDVAAAPAVPEPGLGHAAAQLLRIEPTSAGLAFGVIFGPTSADHRNRVARAVAQSTNFGLIGTALTADTCDGSPPPVARESLPKAQRADSRDTAGHQVTTVSEGPVTQSVVATTKPFARATSRLADVALPGLISLTGVTNESSSGVDDAGIRSATASAHVGEMSLAGGVVELRGMDWLAVHRAGDAPVGTFTIGSVTIAGVPLPTGDATAVLDTVNTTLASLGIVVAAPEVRVVNDTVYVDPLTVGIVPSSTRDAFAGAALAAVHPVREQLFGAILDLDCANSGYVTVLDILLGSVTGGGSMRLSVAGVQSGTGVADEFVFAPAPVVAPKSSAPIEPPAASGGTIMSEQPPASVERTVERGSPPEAVAVAAVSDPVADRALAVALACLALGAVLVEGDRRKMRQAERLDAAGAP